MQPPKLNFRVPFNPRRHIDAGAPEDFYPEPNKVQALQFDPADMAAMIRDTPLEDCMQNIAFVERTVRFPDECREELPQTVEEELRWSRRIALERRFLHNGRHYICICRLHCVDGRLVVPLRGSDAPLIEEVL